MNPLRQAWRLGSRAARSALTASFCAAVLALAPGAAHAVDILVSSFTDVPDPGIRGGTITFTITLENNDTDTANNVVLTYPLPVNTLFVSAADTVVGGACLHNGLTPGTVTCTYPTLLGTSAAPTNGPVRTINVVLRTTGASVTTLNSTVTATTTDTDNNAGNNSLNQNTSIIDGADLSATMAGAPNPATGGGLVTWTVSGSNFGPNTSGTVTYTTTLPAVLSYVGAGSGGAGWSCGASGQVVTCTRAALAVGAYPDLPIVTRITGVASGTITLNGSISSTVGDPDPSNNAAVASVTVNAGTDLAVTQDPPAPNPATSGTSITFVLRPVNNGPYPATAGATVTFPIPAGFSVNTATGSTGWSCISSGSPATVTCNFAGSFASSAAGVLTVVATTPSVSVVTAYNNITATIAPNSGGPADPVSGNNSAAVNVTVTPDGLDLRVFKTKGPAFVALNANMTTTIVVQNNGPRTAASGTVTVVDALDTTHEQYVGFSGTNWSCVSAPPNVTCTYNAALGVFNAPDLTITTVAVAPGGATNTATTSYSGTPGDFDLSNNSAAATVTVTATNNSPDLLVGVSAATAGGVQTTLEFNETQITYTVVVTNKGTSTAAASDIVTNLSIPGRSSATNVQVTSLVLTNTSGTSTATFSCSGTGINIGGGVACTQATGTQLAVGDVVTFTIVADRPLGDGTYNANASAFSASQGDPLPGDNVAAVTVTIDPIADLDLVSKILAQNPVLAGTNATYTLTLTNNGPSVAYNVTLSDVFTIPGGDSGFTYISAAASNSGSCSGLVADSSYTSGTPTLNCSWPTQVDSGGSRTVTVTIRPNWQAGSTPRTLGNVATIATTVAEGTSGGTGVAPNSKSATLNINPAQVDLLINNTDLVDPIGYDSITLTNDDITYIVAETNSGPSLASGTGFTFLMTPPAGKSIVFRGDGAAAGVAAANPSGSIAGSICNNLGSAVTGPSTLTVTCNYPAPAYLANGATQTRYLVWRVGSTPNVGGDVYNTNATVLHNETDGNAANDSEAEGTTVRMRSDLSLTKTPSINPVQIRQPFTWTIAVTNNGPGDSQTTGLVDTLPSGMQFTGTPTYTKSSGGSGTCAVAGSTMTCAFGALPNGAVATVLFGATVQSNPGGGVTQNCATASTSEVDPNASNNVSICSNLTVQTSAVYGTVFQDRDRAGANGGTPQSVATEPRIQGVSIELTGIDAYGNGVSRSSPTDVNGFYGISDLSPSDSSGYTIREIQPVGFVNGPIDPATPATGGAYARGGTSGNSTYGPFVLPGNTVGNDYNFPEVRVPSLSGFVYIDTNQNNVRDAGTDIAVVGATVRLLNASTLSLIATATTNGSGAYTFSNLDPFIAYTLEEPLPSSPTGLQNGTANAGLVDGAACASGCTVQANTPSAGTDRIASINLGAGVDGTLFNFGEQQLSAMSGLVFVDTNRDGVLAGGETLRLAGVTIRLVQGADCTAGTTLQTTTTSGTGTYRFDNVLAYQNYLICETQPVGYGTGSANGTLSSNVITITGLPATESANNNFGDNPASIAGSVYQDSGAGTLANFNNGVRDAGELGIVNVVITLTGTDANGAAVSRTATTDASGNYVFDNLVASNGSGYTLAESTIPSASGTFNDGLDTAGTAGGSNAVNDVLSGVVLSAGTPATGYLFGELPIAPIAGTVYVDRNRNGAIDATPTDGRLAGVTLTLHVGATCSGTVFGTTATDALGDYSFSGASAGGTYTVCKTQPAGYGNGSANPGSNGTSTGPSAISITNLPATGSAANQFGITLGSIAGSVFLDANNDGVRQGGETGIAGVVVTLSGTDVNGAGVSRTLTSDGTGAFLFADLVASNASGYTVTEQAAQPVVGGVPTLNGRSNAGTIGGVASGTPTAVTTAPSAIGAIALTAGADSINNRFGEILPVAITGTVFVDVNANGVQNAPADLGLAAVTIVVTGTDDNGAAVSRTLTTNASGAFSVADLRPGAYTITEPTQPTGTANGITTQGSAGGTATPVGTVPSAISGIVLPAPGASSTANNFAEIPNNGAINGRVFLDLNNNGVVDAGESGIAGITITLGGTDAGGTAVNRTTVTDAGGNYTFANLAPGTYALTEPTQPTATLNGRTVAGSAGGTPTTPATAPSSITAITIGAGVVSANNQFAEILVASLAGRVYADNNNNGIVDSGEIGIASVAITLTGTDDLGAAVSLTLPTAADGSYAFANLRPGTYTITEPTQPAGTSNGITSPGALGGTATSPAVTPSAISGVVLAPGAQGTLYNFGEIGSSPDLMVAKDHSAARFTVNNPATYRIRVRNAGELPTTGVYTVSDRLPPGLTLASTPNGTGWACVGATGASTFTCSSSTVVPTAATNPNAITVNVSVGATAAANSPVNNVALVEGGGELVARQPSTAERDLFANNPGGLPVCSATIANNACRDPTIVQLAASLAGTVWFDVGSAPGLLDAGDQRLAGWQVQAVDGSGTPLASTTTAADGTYRIADLLPGVAIGVRFRDPASGVVFGYPVNGETAPNSSGVTCNEANAIATGGSSSCISRGTSPALSVVLVPGQNLTQQSLPVDPSGVVYDSSARQPVAGAVVTLAPVGACSGWNPSTAIVGATLGGYTLNGTSISMTVGAGGFYQYLFSTAAPASCQFGLTVTPPSGYLFRSVTIPPQATSLTPPGGAGTTYAVQPQAGAPTGAVGTATNYFLTFTSGSAGANVVHNHIAIDPLLPSGLTLSKTGDKTVAQVGDSVRYSVTVRVTAGALPIQVTVLDRVPAGFTFIKGTATVNGVALADPAGGVGPQLAFNLGPMPASGQQLLQYRLRVGVGSQQGDGTNVARAYACVTPAGCVTPAFTPVVVSRATNEGRHTVQVSGGVFAAEACVAGKIYVDCNGNQIQDPEEIGIPGVRLVMQDGTTLISDSEGKYSYCGLPPRSAVLKVDSTTLPRGSRLVTSSNRNLGDAGSLWLDLKNGELHRADFIEGSCSAPVIEQVKARRAQGEVRSNELEKKKGPALRFESKALRMPLGVPREATDSANQPVPQPRDGGASDAH